MRSTSASKKAGSTIPEKSTFTRRFRSVMLSSRPPCQKVQRSRIRLSMASRSKQPFQRGPPAGGLLNVSNLGKK